MRSLALLMIVACAQKATPADVPDMETEEPVMIVCGTGSMLDEATHTCVVSSMVVTCGAGTMLKNGVCELIAEAPPAEPIVQEPAEPNDVGEQPGAFTTPATGTEVTIGGCITPASDHFDRDAYTFTVATASLFNIRVEGRGGLQGAFEVRALGSSLMAKDAWARRGISHEGATAEREVLLPAGDYALVLTDQSTLLSGTVKGNADTCYFATVTGRPFPTPTALSFSAGEAIANAAGVYQASTDGFISYQVSSGAVTALKNGVYSGQNEAFEHAPTLVMDLVSSDAVLLIVDAEQPGTLTAHARTALTLPVGATNIAYDPAVPFQLFTFTATAGDVIALDYNVPVSLDMLLFGGGSRRLKVGDGDIGDLCYSCTGSNKKHVQAGHTGSYYVRVQNHSEVSYSLTLQASAQTPMSLTVPSSTPAALQAVGSFFSVNVAAHPWLSFGATGSVTWNVYKRADEGTLDQYVLPISSGPHSIVAGESQVLLSVKPAADVLENVDVSDRAFTAGGANGISVPSGYDGLFLVTGSVLSGISVASATVDASVQILDASENIVRTVDTVSGVGDERFIERASKGYVAFNAHVPSGTGSINVQGQPVTATTLHASPKLPVADNQVSGLNSSITSAGCVAPGTVQYVGVAVNVQHPWASDLEVKVTSPAASVMLYSHGALPTPHNLVGEWPVSLAPTASMSALFGASGVGDWTLNVADTVASDGGTFVDWSLSVGCF